MNALLIATLGTLMVAFAVAEFNDGFFRGGHSGGFRRNDGFWNDDGTRFFENGDGGRFFGGRPGLGVGLELGGSLEGLGLGVGLGSGGGLGGLGLGLGLGGSLGGLGLGAGLGLGLLGGSERAVCNSCFSTRNQMDCNRCSGFRRN